MPSTLNKSQTDQGNGREGASDADTHNINHHNNINNNNGNTTANLGATFNGNASMLGASTLQRNASFLMAQMQHQQQNLNGSIVMNPYLQSTPPPPPKKKRSLYSIFAQRNPFTKKGSSSKKSKASLKNVNADIAGLSTIAEYRRWLRGLLSIFSLLSILIGLIGIIDSDYENAMQTLNGVICIAGFVCVLRLYSVKALRAGLSDPLYEGRSSIIHSPYLGQMLIELALWIFAPPYLAEYLESNTVNSLDYLSFLRLYNIALYAKEEVLGQHLFVRILSTVGHLPISTSYFIRTAMVYEKAKASLMCVGIVWLALGLAFHQAEGRPIFDSFYFVFVTAGTIGYGDIAPHTYVGKIISFMAWVFGLLIVGWVVSLFQASLNLTDAERNLYLMYRASKRSRDLQHHAAMTLQQAWRFHRLNRLKRLVNGQPSAVVAAQRSNAINPDGTSNIQMDVIFGRRQSISPPAGGVTGITIGDMEEHNNPTNSVAASPDNTTNTNTNNGITSSSSNNGASASPRVVISTSANSRENIALSYAAWRLRKQCERFKFLRIQYREDVAIIDQQMSDNENRFYGSGGGGGLGSAYNGFGGLGGGLGNGGANDIFGNLGLGGFGYGLDQTTLANAAAAAAAVTGNALAGSLPAHGLGSSGAGDHPSPLTLRSPSERSTPNGVRHAEIPSLNLKGSRVVGLGAMMEGAGGGAGGGMASRRRTLSEISTNNHTDTNQQNNNNNGGGGGMNPIPQSNSSNNNNLAGGMGKSKSSGGSIVLNAADYLPPSSAHHQHHQHARTSSITGGRFSSFDNLNLVSADGTNNSIELPRSPRRATTPHAGGGVLHSALSGLGALNGVSMEDVLQIATHSAAVSAAVTVHQQQSGNFGGGGAVGGGHHQGGGGGNGGGSDAIATRKLHQEMKKFTTILTQVAEQQSVLLMTMQELKADVKQVQEDQERMRRNPMRHLFLEGVQQQPSNMSHQQMHLQQQQQHATYPHQLMMQQQQQAGGYGSNPNSNNNSIAARGNRGAGMGLGGGGMSGGPSSHSNNSSPGMGYNPNAPPMMGSVGGGGIGGSSNHQLLGNSSFGGPMAPHSAVGGHSLLYRPGTMDNNSFYAPPPPSGALASTVMGQEEVLPAILRSSSVNSNLLYASGGGGGGGANTQRSTPIIARAGSVNSGTGTSSARPSPTGRPATMIVLGNNNGEGPQFPSVVGGGPQSQGGSLSRTNSGGVGGAAAMDQHPNNDALFGVQLGAIPSTYSSGPPSTVTSPNNAAGNNSGAAADGLAAAVDSAARDGTSGAAAAAQQQPSAQSPAPRLLGAVGGGIDEALPTTPPSSGGLATVTSHSM